MGFGILPRLILGETQAQMRIRSGREALYLIWSDSRQINALINTSGSDFVSWLTGLDGCLTQMAKVLRIPGSILLPTKLIPPFKKMLNICSVVPRTLNSVTLMWRMQLWSYSSSGNYNFKALPIFNSWQPSRVDLLFIVLLMNHHILSFCTVK